MIPCDAPGTSGPADLDESILERMYWLMHRFPFYSEQRAEEIALRERQETSQ